MDESEVRQKLHDARARITTADGEVLFLESDEDFESHVLELLANPDYLAAVLDGIEGFPRRFVAGLN